MVSKKTIAKFGLAAVIFGLTALSTHDNYCAKPPRPDQNKFGRTVCAVLKKAEVLGPR